MTSAPDTRIEQPAGSLPSAIEPIALALAALFSGAAIYILVAEQPARLLLADGPMLRHWQAGIGPATAMQASLAVATAVAGFLAWRRTRARLWLIGMAAMLANLPFTLLLIAPVNAELLAMSADMAPGSARALVERWGQLHGVRAALGALATLLFGWALSRRPTRASGYSA